MSLRVLTEWSLDRPRTVIGTILAVSLLFLLAFPRVTIDTDPENMLEPDQPDRVFYDGVKRDFGIHDLLVVGIVDEQGVFRSESLARLNRATGRILEIPGVIVEDVESLTTTDNVTSAGGLLDIHAVMEEVPASSEGLDRLRREIADNRMLDEKLASRDGTAVALYVPVRSKDESFRISGRIEEILAAELLPGQRYHIAGLPVAEDTFGHEMFLQMAVVAPLAFAAILLLVYLLFRSPAFLVPVGLDAMLAVIWAMGLLIGTGHTVHIMSSMIPVFLMPIAILDDVHVLSAFADRYQVVRSTRRAILEAMEPLYRPMFYTTLTSAAGFGSLALADIPPVRVFGLFTAFGILAAWLFSMTMVPALLSLAGERWLGGAQRPPGRGPIDRLLGGLERLTFARAPRVLVAAVVLLALGVAGVARIRVNDNPVRWFKPGHPVRVADEVMNRLFGGTYMAYLVVEGKGPRALEEPEAMAYLASLQEALEADPRVGKTSSAADIVRRIHRVLREDEAYDRVPETREAVAQFLFLFLSSGDPGDLDNFLDPEAAKANIWVQMKSGDNQDMAEVQERLAQFLRAQPPPEGLVLRWSGLTYINRIWQNLMVVGMLRAVLGSFAVVFVLMSLQFRSLLWGLLSMVPLSVAMLCSYGLVGWVGKDYDMPIAVCAALALGMAIDFAIHYLQRYRDDLSRTGDPGASHRHMFGEPGRAIARNAIIICVGFLPLMFSTLTPYVTVGAFFALLMAFSFLATMLIMPSVLRMAGASRAFGGDR